MYGKTSLVSHQALPQAGSFVCVCLRFDPSLQSGRHPLTLVPVPETDLAVLYIYSVAWAVIPANRGSEVAQARRENVLDTAQLT